jgi:hypothetical protein
MQATLVFRGPFLPQSRFRLTRPLFTSRRSRASSPCWQAGFPAAAGPPCPRQCSLQAPRQATSTAALPSRPFHAARAPLATTARSPQAPSFPARRARQRRSPALSTSARAAMQANIRTRLALCRASVVRRARTAQAQHRASSAEEDPSPMLKVLSPQIRASRATPASVARQAPLPTRCSALRASTALRPQSQRHAALARTRPQSALTHKALASHARAERGAARPRQRQLCARRERR